MDALFLTEVFSAAVDEADLAAYNVGQGEHRRAA